MLDNFSINNIFNNPNKKITLFFLVLGSILLIWRNIFLVDFSALLIEPSLIFFFIKSEVLALSPYIILFLIASFIKERWLLIISGLSILLGDIYANYVVYNSQSSTAGILLIFIPYYLITLMFIIIGLGKLFMYIKTKYS
jgi:hypothetical protein|tara:strand:+ start:1784 stop:2203 length:420 start_codon:yes stop_codon:yes gene_type:complete